MTRRHVPTAGQFFGSLGLLLWLELRRPVLDCQRECCADWRRERGS